MQISPDFLARPITILSTQEPWRHSHLGQRVQNWDMSTIAKQLPTKSTSCQDILWNEDLSQTTTVKKDIDRQYNLHIVNINYHFTQENSVSWIWGGNKHNTTPEARQKGDVKSFRRMQDLYTPNIIQRCNSCEVLWFSFFHSVLRGVRAVQAD